jgi:hypothetical protein
MDVPRIAAGTAGISALALGIVTVAGPSVPDDHWGTRGAVVNALGLLTFAALAVGVELVHRLARPSRLTTAGIRAAQAGLVLMSVESVASQVHGGNTLGPVFLLGLLLSLAGLLVHGIASLRHPGARWLALVPFLALLVAIGAGDRGGFALLGIVWCGLALGARDDVPRQADTVDDAVTSARG